MAACMPGCARRTTRRSVRSSGVTSAREYAPLLGPAVHRRALEAALGELVPASHDEGDDRVGIGIHVPVGGQGPGRHGEARALAQARLEAVEQLVHARLQALVLV